KTRTAPLRQGAVRAGVGAPCAVDHITASKPTGNVVPLKRAELARTIATRRCSRDAARCEGAPGTRARPSSRRSHRAPAERGDHARLARTRTRDARRRAARARDRPDGARADVDAASGADARGGAVIRRRERLAERMSREAVERDERRARLGDEEDWRSFANEEGKVIVTLPREYVETVWSRLYGMR